MSKIVEIFDMSPLTLSIECLTIGESASGRRAGRGAASCRSPETPEEEYVAQTKVSMS